MKSKIQNPKSNHIPRTPFKGEDRRMSVGLNLKPHLFAIAGLALIVVVIFYNVLLPPKPLMAQDSGLVNEFVSRQRAQSGKDVYWNTTGYLGNGGGRLAGKLAKVRIDFAVWKKLLPAEFKNTFSFPFAVFLVGLGFYLFCLSLDLKRLAAFTGAASIMLSGDFISSTYSGHFGKFFMWVYLCFAIWLLTAGIRKRNVLLLLWAGICGGIGVSSQLDVGFIIVMFFFAWTVFLIFQTKNQKKWIKLSAGLGIACVAGLIYSASTIYNLMGLAGSAAGKSSGTKDTRSKAEIWNWATQWSLPKAETLTFVMPGFFGFGLPDSPYWGKIGQDARWPTQHIGFPRFSMSTQNMGIIVIALAILAIVTASKMDSYSKKTIYFWGIAIIIALVFAYGRYFDIGGVSESGFGPYRIFYSLPKMESMRNPLKFLYPFMLGISLLAAYGMQYLITDTKVKGK